jgi:superfamily II DNA or RNA helicase
MISVRKLDEVVNIIDTEPGIAHEISDYFTFTVPGHQFMPTFRNKMWDGKIRLYSHTNHTLYGGLLQRLDQFAEEREYTLDLDPSIDRAKEFSAQSAKQFIDKLKYPFTMRDYQMKAFIHAIRNRRCLLLSPTASGKSLVIHSIARYHEGKRILIIVPTVSLVSQLYSDFGMYGSSGGWDVKQHTHCIMEGRSKETEKPIIISTWQSIYKQPKKYFEKFDVVIGDECHLFKSKSLTSIMTKLTNAKHRIGTTGTLDGTETHQLMLEGLFGPVKQVTTTRELIEKKQLSKFHIKALTLRYTEAERKHMARVTYQEEVDFIIAHEKRRNFVRNLTVSLEGNTLVLFQYVDKHGKPLYESIKNAIDKDRKIFFVYGGTDVDQRERVRAIVEEENNAIIVASNGVYSTGVNIKRLHNIIFTHPGKSKVRTLQSIGRGLRTGENKTEATLYDIVDDLGYKAHKNFAIKHFLERHKHYMDEKFDVKIYKVDLK